MTRLIQISDCDPHADPGALARAACPRRRLAACVARLLGQGTDRGLLTAGISTDETAASYLLAARNLNRLAAPWFWLPGNHDDAALMAETRELLEELDCGAWRILMLDTTVSGQPHGELGAERLEALSARLEEDDRPTLLAMHHPPLPVGSAWIDALGLKDREAFWQALSAYGQVRAILCGHIHQAFASHQRLAEGEVAVFGCPSTTDQFLAGAETFAIDEASRPGYRVLDLREGDVTTWVERVDI